MTRHLLDTTVLIAHLRGDVEVTSFILDLVSHGHLPCVSCVNVAEIERGIRPKERRAAALLLDRLGFLVTTKEAATRAGQYQAEFSKRGRTIHLPPRRRLGRRHGPHPWGDPGHRQHRGLPDT